MEREQIDLAISEIETRLDRLRALYEHYFMGIERIEPSVARKDVERRVADLRKARFQSTAQRFKFQTIVQRYNTMQQHWSRICREIELGTYRRHRLKAEQALASRPSAIPRHEAQFRAPADSLADGEFPAVEIGTGTARLPEETASIDAPPADGSSLPADGSSLPATGVLKRLQGSGSNSLTKGLLTSLPPDLAARAGAKAPPPAAPMPSPSGPAAARPGGAPPAPGPRPAGPAAAASPAPAASAPAPTPPAASPPAAAAAASAVKARDEGRTAAPAAGLSEARVRALHQAYIDARQKTNASAVSFEKLERSLRETESKLRGAHQGRSVDFEVVIKDGKAILKPKLT